MSSDCIKHGETRRRGRERESFVALNRNFFSFRERDGGALAEREDNLFFVFFFSCAQTGNCELAHRWWPAAIVQTKHKITRKLCAVCSGALCFGVSDWCLVHPVSPRRNKRQKCFGWKTTASGLVSVTLLRYDCNTIRHENCRLSTPNTASGVRMEILLRVAHGRWERWQWAQSN